MKLVLNKINYLSHTREDLNKMGYSNQEINEIVYEEAQTHRHLLLGKNRPKRYKDLPSYTLEDFFIALASHEVRHRVQHLLQINLLSPEDEQRAKDPHFGALIEYGRILFEIEPPKGGNKKR